MDEKLKVKVILGSTRQNRFGEQPAKWIADLAKARPDMEVELLDLRDYEMPFYNEPVGASQLDATKSSNETVRNWAAKIREADAFVIATPEYNHSASAVLKNALDQTYKDWNNKAVGFVAWGSVGGARAVEHLRLIAAELQMASVRQAVYIIEPWFMVDEKGVLKPGVLDKSVQPANGMLDQLAKWGKALRSARA